MFHCSVSAAVSAASLFSTSPTAVTPCLCQPHPRIDDDIKIKQNHCLSLPLAFIIREKIRKRRRRRRKGGACMCKWLRNPNSWRHCYVSPCLYFTFLLSFPNVSSSCHPEAMQAHIYFLNYTHTHTHMFTRGHVQHTCKV